MVSNALPPVGTVIIWRWSLYERRVVTGRDEAGYITYTYTRANSTYTSLHRVSHRAFQDLIDQKAWWIYPTCVILPPGI